MSKSILLLNGPNLNLLGTRQPEVYGRTTLPEVERDCIAKGKALGYEVDCRQSNHEGTLVDWIHEAKGKHAGIIINAGAYTHTSIAIMDAFNSVELPVVEVHCSNIHKREEYRHRSYVAKVAVGSVVGFGTFSYILAVEALVNHLAGRK